MDNRVHLNRFENYRINSVQVIMNRMQFYLNNANGIYALYFWMAIIQNQISCYSSRQCRMVRGVER